MTRLIDAYALSKELAKGYAGSCAGEATLEQLVNDATISDTIITVEEQPTVEAIPVDWIENYASEIANKAKANPFAYRGYAEGADWIRNMVKNWREEHGTD